MSFPYLTFFKVRFLHYIRDLSMTSTSDYRQFAKKLQNELETLEEADIPESDRIAIQRFTQTRHSMEDSSLGMYVSHLRRASERADVPLVDMDHADYQNFVFDLRHNHGHDGTGLAETTVCNYQEVLRQFFKEIETDWVGKISVDRPDSTVHPDDMLTQDDIAALTSAAPRPRDIALIEFLADTGARTSLAMSLRVRDVSLDGERATYTPNADAQGLKGANIQPYPIIDAKASMRAYLRHSHPRPDEPNAAFFHKTKQFDSDVSVDDGVLAPALVRKRFKKIASDAGVEKPVNPHNFRHSAISRMWREGWDKQQIQHRVQWTVDTDMWKTYVHVHAEDMNEEIFADAGVVDNTDSLSRERGTCGNCRETLPPHAAYCLNCGEPVTKEARDQLDDVVDAGVEQLAAPDLSSDDRQLAAYILQLIRSGEAIPSLFDGAHASSSSAEDDD